MWKVALLAAGAFALPLASSLPAVAQQHLMERAQDERMRQAQQAPNGGQNRLSQDQIKQVQQALDQKGFNAGRADGVLGRATQQALSKFQRSQKLQQTGQPDDRTLQALGITQNDNMTGAGTTGQGPSNQGQNQPSGNVGNHGPNNKE